MDKMTWSKWYTDKMVLDKIRAYFKESLQLQRTETCQTSKHFQISCQKNLPFPVISDDLFLVIYKKILISSTKYSDVLFSSHFLHFLCFSPSKR